MRSKDAAYFDRAWSVCVSVCCAQGLAGAKTGESIEVLFGRLTQVGSRSHVLDGVHIPKGNVQFWGRPSH